MTSTAEPRTPDAVPLGSAYALPSAESHSAARWPLFVVVVALSAFAVWIVSPRFAIDGPSLVDDWSAISRSPDQLAALARFENPEPERFRPSWIAWNYVQWQTLDAPRGLVGPNIWNVLRLLVFVVGMTLLTALMLPRARGSREAVVHACLAAVPAFAVLNVPKFARDFAWFGPQEPLLLGGLALGGSLLALTARSLLSESPVGALTAAMGVAGSFFWLLGVYQKEVALCAIPLIAAALFVGRSSVSGWRHLSPWRRRALGALGLVTALPLVHVAVQVARITLRGDIVYGAEVDGGAGIARGLRVLYDWSHEAMPQTARDFMLCAVALVLVAAIVRRRIDTLALGALASGALTIVFAAQSGVAVSRYYIPIYALFAVAGSLSLARLPELVQAAGVLIVFFAFFPVTEPRAEVTRWSDEEQQHSEIVALVGGLERSGCTVAAAGLDLETGLALPVLVGLERTGTERTCAEGSAYFVLPPYPGESLPLVRACAPGSLEPIAVGRLLGVHECKRVHADAAEILAASRFRSVTTELSYPRLALSNSGSGADSRSYDRTTS